MLDAFWSEFLLACLLMGLGIGTDAAVATAVRAPFMRTTQVALVWIIGVSATHTIFPMAGYLISYFSLQQLPALMPLIGLIAFFLIVQYLQHEFASLLKADSEPQSTGQRYMLISLGLVLAVSWDALWSGPAKSAQVIAWPVLAVWCSFFVVGAVVAIMTIIAFVLSRKLQAVSWGHSESFGLWLQLSVIGYFGWLALCRYTLGLDIPSLYLLCFSFILTLLLLLIFKQRGEAYRLLES